YAGLLSLAVGIRFVVSPLTAVLSLEHNVKSCVQWQVLYFFSVTVTLSLGRGLDIEQFLQLYVAHELVLYSLYLCVVIRDARQRTVTAEVRPPWACALQPLSTRRHPGCPPTPRYTPDMRSRHEAPCIPSPSTLAPARFPRPQTSSAACAPGCSPCPDCTTGCC